MCVDSSRRSGRTSPCARKAMRVTSFVPNGNAPRYGNSHPPTARFSYLSLNAPVRDHAVGSTAPVGFVALHSELVSTLCRTNRASSSSAVKSLDSGGSPASRCISRNGASRTPPPNGGFFGTANIPIAVASSIRTPRHFTDTQRIARIFGGCFAKSPKTQRAISVTRATTTKTTKYSSNLCITAIASRWGGAPYRVEGLGAATRG